MEECRIAAVLVVIERRNRFFFSKALKGRKRCELWKVVLEEVWGTRGRIWGAS